MTFELRPDLYESISHIRTFEVPLRGKIFSWERVFSKCKNLMWGKNLVG